MEFNRGSRQNVAHYFGSTVFSSISSTSGSISFQIVAAGSKESQCREHEHISNMKYKLSKIDARSCASRLKEITTELEKAPPRNKIASKLSALKLDSNKSSHAQTIITKAILYRCV